ncbi:MAG: redoxin domain-containing protein [Bacteroidetes bacterium]|nr:redoxin domain-containing protein [Bacteroidota bacterium]
MKMYRYISILFLFFGFTAWAAEATVVCEKSSFINQNFRVEIVTDFLTQQKEPVYAGITDDKGSFKASFDIAEVKMVYVILGKAKRTFFAEPGKNYNVFAPPLNPKLVKEEGYMAKDVQPFRFKDQDTNELNFLIDKVDRSVNEFISKHKQNLYYANGPKLILNFIHDLEKLNKHDNPYFKQYLKYTIATFDAILLKNHPEKIRKKYFTGVPIDLNNIQYVGTLQNIYRGYFKFDLANDDKSNIVYLINAQKYQDILHLISPGTPYDSELSSLILINGFLELQKNPAYNEKAMSGLLDSVIAGTQNPNIHRAALNVKSILFHLQPGTTAPEIVLQDTNKTEFKLSNHKGKYVYLSFFKAWDKGYEEEMKVLTYLNERYANNLEIISISTDYDQKLYDQFIQQNKHNWPVIHYQKNEDVLINYRIEDIRVENYERNQMTQWILISPDGKIVYYPAKSPSQGFEYQFKRLIEG